MKYSVNENCIGCGLCVSVCPQVFELTDEGVSHAINEATSKDVEKSAEEALHECPVDAIEHQ